MGEVEYADEDYEESEVEWDLPALKVKRCMNSTCQQGNYIYTFAGASAVEGSLIDGNFKPT